MKDFSVGFCTLFAVLVLPLGCAAKHEHFHHGQSMRRDQMTQGDLPVIRRVNKEGACPQLASDTVGICVEGCSGDSDCEGELKCCSNGCGKQCQKPDEEKQCVIRCTKIHDPVCGSDGVTYDNECSLRDIKCGRNQNFIKQKHEGECPELKRVGPCETELEKYLSPMTRHMVGQMAPQCDENGFYKPMQCSGSTGSCWCVTKDGQEIEAPADRFISSDEDCFE